jgi:rubrerythrin
MAGDRLIVTDGDVDTAAVADYERTRRDLVRRGLAAGGAVLAAASIPVLLRARDAFAQAEDDAGVLTAAIELETVAVEAYERSTNQLSGFARLFRNHERAHREELVRALRSLGEQPPPVDPEGRLSDLGGGVAQRAAFLVELENTGVAAYVDAHRRLRDAKLMKTVSSILNNEAQHLVVLRDLANREPVPAALVTGRRE